MSVFLKSNKFAYRPFWSIEVKYYPVCSKIYLNALEFLSGTEMHTLI